jgi:hypothetical protein
MILCTLEHKKSYGIIQFSGCSQTIAQLSRDRIAPTLWHRINKEHDGSLGHRMYQQDPPQYADLMPTDRLWALHWSFETSLDGEINPDSSPFPRFRSTIISALDLLETVRLFWPPPNPYAID